MLLIAIHKSFKLKNTLIFLVAISLFSCENTKENNSKKNSKPTAEILHREAVVNNSTILINI